MCRTMTLLAGSLALIAGCGIEGTWVTRSADPASSKEFKLACATFKTDNTFEATAQEGGKNLKSKGSYTFDPWRKQLTLNANGKELAYSAAVWWGKELRVKKTMKDGTVITAVMDRRDACPDPLTCAYCEKCPSCKSRMKAASGGG